MTKVRGRFYKCIKYRLQLECRAAHDGDCGSRFAATDCSWTAGEGALIEGPIAAILLLFTGRTAALSQLSGPGVKGVTPELPAWRVGGPQGT